MMLSILLKAPVYLLLARLISASSLRGTSSAEKSTTSASLAQTRQLEERHVKCRMIVLGTLLEGEGEADSLQRVEETACIPIVEGEESDHVIPITLPSEIEQAHKKELQQGLLWVSITNAEHVESRITVSAEAEFSVIDNVPEHLRRLQERRLAVTGSQSIAIIRVSTYDSPNEHSSQSLRNLFNPNIVNFVTQYQRCSINQLNFHKVSDERAVIDVLVNSPVSSFGTGPGALVDAAQNVVRANLGLASISHIADKVLFCLPPGTGSWVGSAGLNHWRSQYNAGWCTSLTATMHELGHQIGLLHSNENFIKYDDKTGYMARGYRNSDWPLRCFNGQNNDHLGWYDQRKSSFQPINTGPALIDLAAFVDYSKPGSQSSPVLIDLADKLYLQYNRAKTFNADTGEMPDQITVVTEPQQGGSQLVAGLSAGQVFSYNNFDNSGRSVYIKACERRDGNGGTADIMRVSIGMDSVAPCSGPINNPGGGSQAGSQSNQSGNQGGSQGGNQGNHDGNPGGSQGSQGGSPGGSQGNQGGNPGGSQGNQGGNPGGDQGNSAGNNQGNSGSNNSSNNKNGVNKTYPNGGAGAVVPPYVPPADKESNALLDWLQKWNNNND